MSDEEPKPNRVINVLTSAGEARQLLVDLDFEIVGEPGDGLQLLDVLQGAVLSKLGELNMSIPSGKYNIRMMATIVGEANEVSDAED